MGSWHSWFQCLQRGGKCSGRIALLWATARKMLLTKMTKQLISWSEVCQDWSLWSLILVSARQNQFPLKIKGIYVCERRALCPSCTESSCWLGWGLHLGRWRTVGLELEAEGKEQQSYWTKALAYIPARVFQLRGSSGQEIVPSSKASCCQSDSLPCFAEVTTLRNHKPPCSSLKEWVKAIYSCYRCRNTFLNNICTTTLNSFLKCCLCILPSYQHCLLHQILLFSCHLQLLADLVGTSLASNSSLQFPEKYGVLLVPFFPQHWIFLLLFFKDKWISYGKLRKVYYTPQLPEQLQECHSVPSG